MNHHDSARTAPVWISETPPPMRRVDALTGQKADGFFRALSEADNHCRELDGLRELQTRNQELEAEVDELKRELWHLKGRRGNE